jgi:hypothetical protein
VIIFYRRASQISKIGILKIFGSLSPSQGTKIVKNFYDFSLISQRINPNVQFNSKSQHRWISFLAEFFIRSQSQKMTKSVVTMATVAMVT